LYSAGSMELETSIVRMRAVSQAIDID